MNKLNIRGDTIVEVLIAITVVSTVLGGAYASSNRSLNATRQSQERGEALKLAETQLERLKASITINADIFSTPNYFCFDENIDADSLSDPDNVDAYPDMCLMSPQAGVTYYLAIQGPGHPSGLGSDTFRVTSRWAQAGGRGTELGEEVSLIYRMHRNVSGSGLPPTQKIPPPKPPVVKPPKLNVYVPGPTKTGGNAGKGGKAGNQGGAGAAGQAGNAGGNAGQAGGAAAGGNNPGQAGGVGPGGRGGVNPNGANIYRGGAGGQGWDP